MIPLFISSKNRPIQLRLLLDSIRINCRKLFDVTVLYKAENLSYELGYKKLERERLLPVLRFVEEEKSANGMFINQLNDFMEIYSDFFCLMVDDNILYRQINQTADEIIEQFTEDVFCVSLRLGRNTIRPNYMNLEVETPLAKFEETSNDFIKWDWTEYESNSAKRDFSNYGLPFTWDGGIYRTEDIRAIIESSGISHPDFMSQFPLPHKMESAINSYVIDNPIRPFLASPSESCIIGMDWNKVINTKNKGGRKVPAPPLDMNEYYLKNMAIDINSIDFANIESCHEELSFKFKRIENEHLQRI